MRTRTPVWLRERRRPWKGLAGAALALLTLSGCAAVTNPVGDGVPVRRLPPEVLGRPREEERVIPLTLLRQPPPPAHIVDAGDVLGVWIEGVLGDRNQPPPVQNREGDQPSIGFPVPVRQDGTISLPFVEPLLVRGLTLQQVQELIRRTYTETKQILVAGRERILVELQKRRTYHVLVIRQDSGGLTISEQGAIGSTKRGTGFDLRLPAYENDVLNALARTGGFPGLDAKNEVIIERGSGGPPPAQGPAPCLADGRLPPGWGGGSTIRIPLRLRPDEPIPFRPEDVILNNGDIVYIESRDTEVFYTGGLLGSGQYPLPRDYDLDVVEAISLVKGPLISGGLNTNQNQFTGSILQAGLGAPSPSLVTIIRRTPGGGQIPIRVDLNYALRDPRERVLIQPKDIIILQETVGEALTRYATSIFRLDFFGTILRRRDATALTTINAP